MTCWLQTGSSGFRLGFCLPKLLTQFAPVWQMGCVAPLIPMYFNIQNITNVCWGCSVILQMFLAPSILMFSQTGAYFQLQRWLLRTKNYIFEVLRIQESAEEINIQVATALCDARLDEQIALASQTLFTMTLGLGVGLWSPQVLLFAALAPACFLSAFEVSEQMALSQLNKLADANETVERKQKAEMLRQRRTYIRTREKLTSHILMPMPNLLMKTYSIALLWCSILFVLIDFSFGICSWVVFGMLTLLQLAWVLCQRKNNHKRATKAEVLWQIPSNSVVKQTPPNTTSHNGTRTATATILFKAPAKEGRVSVETNHLNIAEV